MKRIIASLFVLMAVFVTAEEKAKNKTEEKSKSFLKRWIPPVKLEPLPITKKEGKRSSGIKVTNHGKKDIEEIVLQIFYLRSNGSLIDDSMSTLGYWEEFPHGKSIIVEQDDFDIEKDTTEIYAFIKKITYTDGTVWPVPPSKAPPKKGKNPASIEMVGIVGEGKCAEPVLYCFNYGGKDITSVSYRIKYMDKNGKLLHSSGFAHMSRSIIQLPKDKGGIFIGGDPPPEGTADVEVSISVGFPEKKESKPKD